MTFRITKENNERGMTLHIDGILTYEGLGEFGKAYEGIIKPITIDLSGLTFADELVVKLLKQMAREGVQLEGASPYLSIRLSHHDHENK